MKESVESEYSPFDAPAREPGGRVFSDFEEKERSKPKLKSVFCSYGGILIVDDVYGTRVGELSGEITLEKHNKIQLRKTDDTEFYIKNSEYNYKKAVERLQDASMYSPFDAPVREPKSD